MRDQEINVSAADQTPHVSRTNQKSSKRKDKNKCIRKKIHISIPSTYPMCNVHSHRYNINVRRLHNCPLVCTVHRHTGNESTKDIRIKVSKFKRNIRFFSFFLPKNILLAWTADVFRIFSQHRSIDEYKFQFFLYITYTRMFVNAFC